MARGKLVPLTYEEHVTLGVNLKAVREQLLTIVIRTSRGYGVSSRSVKLADQATVAVDRLRCELDSLLCQSLAPSDSSWRGVYYGKNSKSK